MRWRGSWTLSSRCSLSVRVHTTRMRKIDGPNASHQRETRGLLTTSQHQRCGGGLKMWRETLKLPRARVFVGLSTLFSTSRHASARFLSAFFYPCGFFSRYGFSFHNIICDDRGCGHFAEKRENAYQITRWNRWQIHMKVALGVSFHSPPSFLPMTSDSVRIHALSHGNKFWKPLPKLMMWQQTGHAIRAMFWASTIVTVAKPTK